MLVTIEQVLQPQELARLRALLQMARWVSGLETAGPQAATVKNNEQVAEGTPELSAARELVLAALNRNALFFSAALPNRVLPPFFNRYRGASNAYGAHVDGAIRQTPDACWLRTDVSATLFLSDPDSYDGGELTVHDTYGVHRVKLAAGAMVVYPSSSVHEVLPVTRGERLACFMFIESLIRDPSQRRLLFDLDMALLALRSQLGETAPIVKLTGVYHNLLRQWAQP